MSYQTGDILPQQKGWQPPPNCPRCRNPRRNWAVCTCIWQCGRVLDCNGLRP